MPHPFTTPSAATVGTANADAAPRASFVPEADARRSAAPEACPCTSAAFEARPPASAPSTRREAVPGAHAAASAALDADLARLVENAIGAIIACDVRPDAVFGDHAGLIAMARSVSYHEGKLLEAAIRRIAACNPDLVLMPRDTALPIVPAAEEALRRNDWSNLKGIRLRSEVHARKSYTPDLLIANARRHSALVIDVKRSLASHSEHKLERLRCRMMAVGLIAADWIHVEYGGPAVDSVGIAIVDGSNERSDPERGIVAIREVEGLLEVEGAAAALERVRTMFAERMRDALDRRARTVLARLMPEPHRADEAEADVVATSGSAMNAASAADAERAETSRRAASHDGPAGGDPSRNECAAVVPAVPGASPTERDLLDAEVGRGGPANDDGGAMAHPAAPVRVGFARAPGVP